MITDCYTHTRVTGFYKVGGFTGINRGSIYRSYSTGTVGYPDPIKGFANENAGNIVNCYWDTQSSSTSQSDGGEGLTTPQMQQSQNYDTWNFEFDWRICEGTNYPKLQWQWKPEADMVCPDGVDFADLAVMADQWMMVKLDADIINDGIVDFSDWAAFTNGSPDMVSLAGFTDQWQMSGVYIDDIEPYGGDNDFDFGDLMVFCMQWLEGI